MSWWVLVCNAATMFTKLWVLVVQEENSLLMAQQVLCPAIVHALRVYCDYLIRLDVCFLAGGTSCANIAVGG